MKVLVSSSAAQSVNIIVDSCLGWHSVQVGVLVCLFCAIDEGVALIALDLKGCLGMQGSFRIGELIDQVVAASLSTLFLLGSLLVYRVLEAGVEALILLLSEVACRGQAWCEHKHVIAALAGLLLLLTNQLLLRLEYSVRSVPIRFLDRAEHHFVSRLGPQSILHTLGLTLINSLCLLLLLLLFGCMPFLGSLLHQS